MAQRIPSHWDGELRRILPPLAGWHTTGGHLLRTLFDEEDAMQAFCAVGRDGGVTVGLGEAGVYPNSQSVRRMWLFATVGAVRIALHTQARGSHPPGEVARPPQVRGSSASPFPERETLT